MVILKRLKIFLLIAILFLTPITNLYHMQRVGAISTACSRSAACKAAVAAENAAKNNASQAKNTASSYAQAVAYKNSEIAEKEREIAESKATITELMAQIDATTQKLTRQQSALAGLVVDMHFGSNNDPVLILADSKSISDFAEKKAREETVKEQVIAANEKIKSLKADLEQQRASAEANLAVQKLAEQDLINARAELQNLVAKYQHDAAAYEAEANNARAAQKAAEEAEIRAHPELYNAGTYYGATNSYEWKNDCPQRQDAYTTYYNGKAIGGYVCECVSYAAWKVYETFGIAVSWGNAYSWDEYARARGYVVNNTPSAHSVGQSNSGRYGHVFWVESVNSDGSINVTEYNNYYSTGKLTGKYHSGDFGSRTLSASEARQYNYIHF